MTGSPPVAMRAAPLPLIPIPPVVHQYRWGAEEVVSESGWAAVGLPIPRSKPPARRTGWAALPSISLEEARLSRRTHVQRARCSTGKTGHFSRESGHVRSFRFRSFGTVQLMTVWLDSEGACVLFGSAFFVKALQCHRVSGRHRFSDAPGRTAIRGYKGRKQQADPLQHRATKRCEEIARVEKRKCTETEAASAWRTFRHPWAPVNEGWLSGRIAGSIRPSREATTGR